MGVVFLRGSSLYAQGLGYFDTNSPSVTNNINDVVHTDDITHPFRDGTYLPVQSPDGNNSIPVINVGRIFSFQEAENQTLRLIKNIINYALSFAILIVFLFLIYEGYLIVIYANDDDQYKKALTRVKTAAIALAGMAISWLLVSFIFNVVDQLL